MSRIRQKFVRYGGERCGTLINSTNQIIPQFTPSRNGAHSCTDETHPGPPYRSGGPLSISKVYYDIHRTPSVSIHYGVIPTGYYDGYFSVNAYVPPVMPSKLNLSGWGAKGWNRTYPLHPVYAMGVSLLELKDFPRMIQQTMEGIRDLRGIDLSAIPMKFRDLWFAVAKGPKYMADHFLNLSFGWLPFMQDLQAVANYQENLAKKLRWLRNKNNKSVKRRVVLDAGGFSEDIPRNVSGINTMSPVFATQVYSGNIVASQPFPIRKSYDRKIWFVARYKVHIPELSGIAPLLRDHTRLKLALYGIDLDPSVIYKVIPWTWLLDWFTNVGSILQNIYFRAKYQTVAEYAYVMCSEVYRYDAPGKIIVHTGLFTNHGGGGVFYWDGPDRTLQGITKTKIVHKQREVANPYGFGLTFSSLSAYQWSILAALGLSRSRSVRA